MATKRTTVSIDEAVLRAVKINAAHTGRSESAVIESALRDSLGLDVLDDLWSKATMTADDAMELALEAQRAARKSRRKAA